MSEQPSHHTRAGYQKKSLARLAAVQAVFEIQQAQANIPRTLLHHLNNGLTLEDGQSVKFDQELFKSLVTGTCEHEEYLQQLISHHLASDWRLERLDSVLRIILQVAIYELKSFKETDIPIIVSEYVRLTDAFLDSKQTAFVNKILDVVGQQIRNSDDFF